MSGSPYILKKINGQQLVLTNGDRHLNGKDNSHGDVIFNESTHRFAKSFDELLHFFWAIPALYLPVTLSVIFGISNKLNKELNFPFSLLYFSIGDKKLEMSFTLIGNAYMRIYGRSLDSFLAEFITHQTELQLGNLSIQLSDEDEYHRTVSYEASFDRDTTIGDAVQIICKEIRTISRSIK